MLNITSHQGNANLNHNETVNNTHLKFVERVDDMLFLTTVNIFNLK